MKLAGCYDDISFVIDYFTIKKEKYAALERIAMTNRIFVLTGYIPEKRAAKVIDALEKKYTVAIEITDPDADADVPVLLENNAFVAPVEPITEMYSMPNRDVSTRTPLWRSSTMSSSASCSRTRATA